MKGLIFSIIICTKNRSEHLRELLKSLSQLRFPKEKFEIIVIDNNSSDDTKIVTLDFKGNFQYLRYFLFAQNGLSRARNFGISKSRGKFIAFVDDDVTVNKKWLISLYNTFQKTKAIAVGGCVKLVFEKKTPNWLTNHLKIYLAELDYGNKLQKIKAPDYLVGANIAFNKMIFKKIGGFSEKFGRKNNSLLSSEELELCRRIEKNEGLIFYNHSALAYHHIDDSRLNKKYFFYRAYWQGISDARLDKLHGRPMALGNRPPFSNLIHNILNFLFKPSIENAILIARTGGYLQEYGRK